jgi:hypothetical protein
MTRVFSATLAVFAISFSFCAAGQTIYKCEEGGQTVFSQQPCADNAEQFELEESYTPDGSQNNTGIDFRRTTCQTRQTGTPEAIVELANLTDQVRAGELKIHFLRGGEIVEVVRERFLLPEWGSETFSRLGPIGSPVDDCEYLIRIESP